MSRLRRHRPAPRPTRRTATHGAHLRRPRPSRVEASEALFRTIADEAPIMLWLCTPDGLSTFVNKSWLEFTGRPIGEQLGRGWLAGVHKDDLAGIRERFWKARTNQQPFTFEYRLMRADGQYRWLLGHGSPRIGSNGALLGYVGSCADITDRKVGSAPFELKGRFERLIYNADDLVYRTRVFPTRVVEYVSSAARTITGHSPEEFYADPFLSTKAVHADDRHLVMMADPVDPSSLHTHFTLRWVHPDGKIVWAEHRRVPVYDESGKLIAIEGIARDITERVESQSRMRESEEQLRQLAAHVQSAREDERAALARELHDELGQTLTAVKLELGRAAEAMTRERVTPRSIDRLQSLVGLIEIGIETVKRLSTELRPPALDHLGLPAAVRWEAMSFRSRTGIRCHVRAVKDGTALDKEQQTVLFRIFQEALTNIVRHASASAVHVTLAERPRTFELRIRDNGGGITETEIRDPHSIGLLGMRERATLVGGTFDITGQRGKGTLVTVRVPIRGRAR
jgi:two-component system, NarL family, sensor histidine kinase UhpB